jgi:16S rRNA (adenine1518-N6/adenine1519-N6)-dimethyltransferase
VRSAHRSDADGLPGRARSGPPLGAGSKRLGQHFLVDASLRDQVVAAAGITADDEVLEVGAGPGTLTAELASRARRVVAVELDRRLLPALKRAAPTAEIIQADILKLDLTALFPLGGEVVVGNIPYYLSGALIEKLLQHPPLPRRLSLVVQQEVAERWCGVGGWSLATVAVQTLAAPRIALRLPPEAFDPAPDVHSALVVMEVRDQPAVKVDDLNRFFRFVEVVFQFRRKQLATALVRVTGRPRPELEALLSRASIEPTRRAETLALDKWEVLYTAVSPKRLSE